jgi:hypothetical protein
VVLVVQEELAEQEGLVEQAAAVVAEAADMALLVRE